MHGAFPPFSPTKKKRKVNARAFVRGFFGFFFVEVFLALTSTFIEVICVGYFFGLPSHMFRLVQANLVIEGTVVEVFLSLLEYKPLLYYRAEQSPDCASCSLMGRHPTSTRLQRVNVKAEPVQVPSIGNHCRGWYPHVVCACLH